MPCGTRIKGCGGVMGRSEKPAAKRVSTSDLLSIGKIAEELGATPARVKKAIAELGLKAASSKGACSYYTREALAKIAVALG